MENAFIGLPLKLRHIQCFIAVAQLNSLQRAAERLSLTQPAISKTLAELEALVGAKLFERGRRGAALTPDGRAFAPYANACLGSLRDGIGKLSASRQPAPATVALGALPTVASVLLPEALRRHRAAWPGANIQVVIGRNIELIERLRSAEIELALARLGDPEAMAGMNFEHLFREPMVAVVQAGHPLLGLGVLTAESLGGYPLIMPPAGTLIRQSAESMIAELGIVTPAGTLESLSVSLNLAVTLHNDAIWFVPSSLVEHEVASGLLARLPMPAGGTDEPIGLIRRTDIALSPAGASLLDALRQVGLGRERRRVGAA
ncbi:pca operon transcription factor PcaQ [Bordetella petrii]|uniref:pca operon transcription factor PcaQ n=1 Tax=Bordetella petrii TaxID=94624 RepID=UPI003733ED99